MPVIPLDLKARPIPTPTKSIDRSHRRGREESSRGRPGPDAACKSQKQALKDINSELAAHAQYVWRSTPERAPPVRRTRIAVLGSRLLLHDSAHRLSRHVLQNTFNYSSPEYQVGMTLSINLRNRQAKADQFRAVLQYRQSQITSEQQKKNILLRRAQLAVCS